MASLPFRILELRAVRLAQQLRWRWRGVLKEAAEIAESDMAKALGDAPPSDDLFAQMDAVLETLNKQTAAILQDALGLAVASGIWTMKTPWGGTFRQPKNADLQAITSAPTFQDVSAMRFAVAYGGAAVQSKDAAVMGQFKLNLLDALREGDSPRKAAAKTAEALGEDPSQWERIARTEMARAQHLGGVEEAKRLGVDYVVVPDQPKNCEHCRRLLANRVFPLSALSTASNVGRKQNNWIPAIPLHPNCTCVAIPASASTVQGARLAAGGSIPSEGASIADLPEPKDR
jgi:hypothetical protein